MRDQTKAYLYAGATVLAWSTSASAFKLTLSLLSPVELLLYAALSSSAVLACVLVAQRGLDRLRGWSRGAWLRCAGLGALNPFLYYLVLFEAYDRLPAQEAQPLNYTWPVVLVLLSAVVLRQRLQPMQVLAMLVSFIGVVVISTRGELLAMRFTDPVGVALALGSTLIWASYWLFNARDTGDPVATLLVSSVFGAGYVAGYVVLGGDWRWPPLAGLAGAAYIGVFEMGLTFVMWLSALRLSASAAQVSGLIYLCPFLSLMVIGAVVGEPIYRSTLVGLTLIVTGVVLQQVGGRWPRRRLAGVSRPRPGQCPP